MPDSINFVNVTKTYGRHVEALKRVSFSIAQGEFVFVIGESGAGKSTLVKLLTREEKPTDGTILLNNFNITALHDKHVPYMRRKIGMIFQDYRLINTKTVYENVAFAMEIVGASPKVIHRRVPIVLRLVGLRHKAKMYPRQLSGGEAQRVGIARAVVNNPRIILADEPTGNLDPANSESIMGVLTRVNREGTTVLCCTHDIALVRRLSQRVLEFHNGVLVADNGGGFCSLPERPTYEHDEVKPNMDLERVLGTTPEMSESEVTAAMVQADIDRILSRLPRRHTTRAAASAVPADEASPVDDAPIDEASPEDTVDDDESTIALDDEPRDVSEVTVSDETPRIDSASEASDLAEGATDASHDVWDETKGEGPDETV